MWIDSRTAAYVCGISPSYFQRLARSLGIVADEVRGLGGRQSRWGARHIIAVLLVPRLERLGVETVSAVAVAKRIAAGSDEQLEAAIESGRSWVMVCGSAAMPELVFRENITAAGSERESELAARGVKLVGLDLARFWNEIRQATTPKSVESEAEHQPAE